MSKATPSLSSAAAMPLTKAACASGASRLTAGSTTFRHTDVLERIAGSRARKSIHVARLTQSAMTLVLPSARARKRGEPAGRLRPFERVEIVFHAQHRRRVDGFALEDSLDDLAAFGHAENLRQRPGRRVALEPRDRARREDQHAMGGFTAERLLPGEGHDIELRPFQRLRERGRGRVADGQAGAVGGDPVGIRGRARPRWCRSR